MSASSSSSASSYLGPVAELDGIRFRRLDWCVASAIRRYSVMTACAASIPPRLAAEPPGDEEQRTTMLTNRHEGQLSRPLLPMTSIWALESFVNFTVSVCILNRFNFTKSPCPLTILTSRFPTPRLKSNGCLPAVPNIFLTNIQNSRTKKKKTLKKGGNGTHTRAPARQAMRNDILVARKCPHP